MNSGSSPLLLCCDILYYLSVPLWRTVDVSGLLSRAYQRGADLSAECHGVTQSQWLY